MDSATARDDTSEDLRFCFDIIVIGTCTGDDNIRQRSDIDDDDDDDDGTVNDTDENDEDGGSATQASQNWPTDTKKTKNHIPTIVDNPICIIIIVMFIVID